MITDETTVLELVGLYPETKLVFDHYTHITGICICCEALFCTLNEVTDMYGIAPEELMIRLKSVIW